MELVELMKRIVDKNVPHYSVWFGEEQKILDIYISKVLELGYKPVYLDSVSQLVSTIGKKSLDKSCKCYIVNEDKEWTTKETHWESIKATMDKSCHILILRYATLNKTYKFYKQNECIEFPKLSTDVLVGYIQKDLFDLSEDRCRRLCQVCNNDYGRILLELDKLMNYCEFHNVLDSNKGFDILMEQGAIYCDIGDITFELTDAVLYGASSKALKLLYDAKRKGEPAMMIASILYTGFRNMLAYQGLGPNKQDAGRRTGLTGWQISQTQKNIGGYSIQEIIRNIFICQRIESGIKNGTIEEDVALDYLVLSCLQ